MTSVPRVFRAGKGMAIEKPRNRWGSGVTNGARSPIYPEPVLVVKPYQK